jgi:hypothetical protein
MKSSHGLKASFLDVAGTAPSSATSNPEQIAGRSVSVSPLVPAFQRGNLVALAYLVYGATQRHNGAASASLNLHSSPIIVSNAAEKVRTGMEHLPTYLLRGMAGQ